jgi:hypothetical protein
LRRDATELKLDAVFEPAAAGVGELAPGSHGQREVCVADEVVAGDSVLALLRREDDEKVLGVVDVNREIPWPQLEEGAEGHGDLVDRDRRPCPSD